MNIKRFSDDEQNKNKRFTSGSKPELVQAEGIAVPFCLAYAGDGRPTSRNSAKFPTSYTPMWWNRSIEKPK